MLNFFKKARRNRTVDLSALKADMHSHLITGIDDGAKTADDSIALVQGLHELGYRKLVTTPHVMSEIYPNTPDIINTGLARLKNDTSATSPDMQLAAAAEYFLDETFDSRLQEDKLLTISDNMVLVEFSFVSTPLNAKEKIFQMQVKGYQPVLAHPERYLYFAKSRSQFDELKSIGCLYQVNLLSLAGYYGKLAQELAQHLVTKGYVDFLGTDMHHLRHLDTLRNSGFIMDTVDKLMDSGNIRNPMLIDS
jgi:protein-tyrosine phosphatase